MEKYGFDAKVHIPNDINLIVGRVVSEHRGLYKVMTEKGLLKARLTGRMYFEAGDEEELPAVGDFAGLEYMGIESESIIREILPRKSVFVRKAAGPENKSQTVAANFDYVFIVTSLNYDFNISRLDRYMSIAWDSGGIPVIILSKADLIEDSSGITDQIEANHPGVKYHMTSNVSGEGMDDISKYFTEGKTAVFLGSSGVGKSSLLNYLSGEKLMDVKDLRSDMDKGRHTTTHRQLFILPEGGIVIDTPGMRELGLWHSEEGVEKSFSSLTDEIDKLSGHCKFADCSHDSEPGCAVKDAIKSGDLSQEQYDRYKKLQKEARHIESKISDKARIDENNRTKAFAKKIKNHYKPKW